MAIPPSGKVADALTNVYNFFFHPFHKSHSNVTKLFSVVTLVALSAITISGFFFVFAAVNLGERCFKVRSGPTKERQLFDQHVSKQTLVVREHKDGIDCGEVNSAKIQNLQERHARQLADFEQWAANDHWHLFSHQHSHYDWWVFPIDRPSQGQGTKYQMSKADIAALKQDVAFMRNYRRAVQLVVESWGWDLAHSVPCDHGAWTGYGVRLGKMGQSLQLFGEEELFEKLRTFYLRVCCARGAPPLDKWIHAIFRRGIGG